METDLVELATKLRARASLAGLHSAQQYLFQAECHTFPAAPGSGLPGQSATIRFFVESEQFLSIRLNRLRNGDSPNNSY